MRVSPLTFLFFLTYSLSQVTTAQWSTDPSNNLIVGYGLLPELASDSSGGCYITYEQNGSYPRSLVLERLDRYGYKPWSGSKQITGLFPEQSSAKIISDGSNGVIVTYLDIVLIADSSGLRGTSRVRVQRVDSNGNFLWGTHGVRVTASETEQSNQTVVSDGNGGCIIAWNDTLGDLRINRVDSLGSRAWGDSGKYVWNSPERPPMIEDGIGGCYIVYGIGRLQRFNQYGNMYWPSSGILVPAGAVNMKRDLSSSIYLLGSEYLGFSNGANLITINLQKVDSAGSFAWGSNGIDLDTLNTNGYVLFDFTYQAGYSNVSWPQYINGHWDLLTQIVRNDGSSVLPPGHHTVSAISSEKILRGIIASKEITTLYVWTDYRSGDGTFAQCLDTLGQHLWDSNDVAISLPALSYTNVISDCQGGFIVVGSKDNFTIRAQQVSVNGKLGEIITNVEIDDPQNLPKQILLSQNYPNPFNGGTVIEFSISERNYVSLVIFDNCGRQVDMPYAGWVDKGTYNIKWDGSRFSSGVYFSKLTYGAFSETRRMLLIR